MRQFVPIIHETAIRFVARMDKMCEEGCIFDALLYFNYFAFDVLSDLAFGEPIGMIEKVSILEHNQSSIAD